MYKSWQTTWPRKKNNFKVLEYSQRSRTSDKFKELSSTGTLFRGRRNAWYWRWSRKHRWETTMCSKRSPHVRSSHWTMFGTYVPVEEAIETALKELYSSDKVPEIPKSAMKGLLKKAITNIQFKCNKFGTLLWEIFDISIEGKENKISDTKRMCIDCNLTLHCEGKESSANLANFCFMQNAKVSLTQEYKNKNIRTCRKLLFFL